MRLYESILEGIRRYHASGTDATKHVGGRRTPNHQVSSIDTEAFTTKTLLLAALNGDNWVGKRTVIHAKGETGGWNSEPAAPEEAPGPLLGASPSGGSHHPSEFPEGVQAAFWSVLQTLRGRKPGETVPAHELARMELALEKCAGACGITAIPDSRKAALVAEHDAYLGTLETA